MNLVLVWMIFSSSVRDYHSNQNIVWNSFSIIHCIWISRNTIFSDYSLSPTTSPFPQINNFPQITMTHSHWPASGKKMLKSNHFNMQMKGVFWILKHVFLKTLTVFPRFCYNHPPLIPSLHLFFHPAIDEHESGII